jgi:hypothetical protein
MDSSAASAPGVSDVSFSRKFEPVRDDELTRLDAVPQVEL